MKKLSIEEKAKRYDEALKRAKDVYTYYCDDREQLRKIESIFPELKESEVENVDEKVRKALIKLVTNHASMDLFIEYDIHLDETLAWLEKQGEHANFLNKIQIGDKVTRNKDGVLVNLSQLKRIAKPAEEYNITGIGSKHAEGKLAEKIKELNDTLEKQGEQPRKVSIWKHWKDGIAGNGEGKLIYLVKVGNTYRLTSCLGFECDYIELSELDSLMFEKQGEQIDIVNKEYWRGYREGKKEILDKYAELEKQGEKSSDKIVEKARTEKQRVLLTETDGGANIDWDCRSLQDVKLLLEYGLDYIKKLEKQSKQKPADSYCRENCKGFQETGKCFADGDCKAKQEQIKKNLQDNSFRRMFEQCSLKEIME